MDRKRQGKTRVLSLMKSLFETSTYLRHSLLSLLLYLTAGASDRFTFPALTWTKKY